MIRDPPVRPLRDVRSGRHLHRSTGRCHVPDSPPARTRRLGDNGLHPRFGNPRPCPRHSPSRPFRPVPNPGRSRPHRPRKRPRSKRSTSTPSYSRRTAPPRRHLDHALGYAELCFLLIAKESSCSGCGFPGIMGFANRFNCGGKRVGRVGTAGVRSGRTLNRHRGAVQSVVGGWWWDTGQRTTRSLAAARTAPVGVPTTYRLGTQ